MNGNPRRFALAMTLLMALAPAGSSHATQVVDLPMSPWRDWESTRGYVLLHCPQAELHAGVTVSCHVEESWKLQAPNRVSVTARRDLAPLTGQARARLLVEVVGEENVRHLQLRDDSRHRVVAKENMEDVTRYLNEVASTYSLKAPSLRALAYWEAMKTWHASAVPAIVEFLERDLCFGRSPWYEYPPDLEPWVDALLAETRPARRGCLANVVVETTKALPTGANQRGSVGGSARTWAQPSPS